MAALVKYIIEEFFLPVARAAGKRFALTFDSQAEKDKDAPIKAETGAKGSY